jgi:uncharacterized Zn finger protein
MKTKIDEKVVAELQQLDYAQIQSLDQEVAGGKALEYYENSQISRATVFRNKISGRVGNFLEGYDVEIVVHGAEIAVSCSCRRSRRICKHAVALLYSWINDSRDFLDIGVTLQEIKAMDKDRLIEIVSNILRINPSFVDLFLAKNISDWDDIEGEPLG